MKNEEELREQTKQAFNKAEKEQTEQEKELKEKIKLIQEKTKEREAVAKKIEADVENIKNFAKDELQDLSPKKSRLLDEIKRRLDANRKNFESINQDVEHLELAALKVAAMLLNDIQATASIAIATVSTTSTASTSKNKKEELENSLSYKQQTSVLDSLPHVAATAATLELSNNRECVEAELVEDEEQKQIENKETPLHLLLIAEAAIYAKEENLDLNALEIEMKKEIKQLEAPQKSLS